MMEEESFFVLFFDMTLFFFLVTICSRMGCSLKLTLMNYKSATNYCTAVPFWGWGMDCALSRVLFGLDKSPSFLTQKDLTFFVLSFLVCNNKADHHLKTHFHHNTI